MRNFFQIGFALLAGIMIHAGERRGAVCFTFDDYHGKNWLAADALFKKYDAHASFFIVGEITPEKAEVMKKLQKAGHSVGLHSLHHRDAVPFTPGRDGKWYFENEVKPQLEACRANGIRIRCFAYPNNRHDEHIDRMLFEHFDYLRAGRGKTSSNPFLPIGSLKKKMVLAGGGIGTYYHSDLAELKKLLRQAAESNSLIVFFSHNILPEARHVHMSEEWLEELLKYARGLHMHIVGAEELDALRTEK